MESCSGQSWPQMISIHALREEGDASPVQPLRMVGNFYPRPPRGGRQGMTPAQVLDCLFLSTPSARRATLLRWCPPPPCRISIHALREEGDGSNFPVRKKQKQFLSTPSARRATRWYSRWCLAPKRISIHALREEGDSWCRIHPPGTADFYPRPPRGGRRAAAPCPHGRCYFYPRPPRGGRPIPRRSAGKNHRYFYPRPPRGGRPLFLAVAANIKFISIHALREEGDARR